MCARLLLACLHSTDYLRQHPLTRLPECGSDIQRLTQLLCDAFEYEELPVRHNEDELNGELAKLVPWEVGR